MCFTFSFRFFQAKHKDRGKVCMMFGCLKKEDGVILTANCTCVTGCAFVSLSFILLYFILKNKHLPLWTQRIHDFNWKRRRHSGQSLNILCTFTIGRTCTSNSLMFSNFPQRLLHNIYFMYHTFKSQIGL